MQWSQCVVGATGRIIGPPRSLTVYAGERRATFWCLSADSSLRTLAWDFIPSSTGEKVNIARGRYTATKYSDPLRNFVLNSPKYSAQYREGPNYVPCWARFEPKFDLWYVLNILNVDHSDAGEYICRVGVEITDEDKAKQDHAPSEEYDEYSDQPADNDKVPQYESRSAYLTVLKLPRRQGKHSHYDSVQVGQ